VSDDTDTPPYTAENVAWRYTWFLLAVVLTVGCAALGVFLASNWPQLVRLWSY
jgi:hypothetical protein